MKKSGIIIIVILAVVLVGMGAFVKTNTTSVSNTPKGDVKLVTAPDQEEAMENQNFTEAVYVPPVIEGKNVALDGLLDANGYTDVYPATNANDGSSKGGSYWEGPATGDSILTLNLKKKISIYKIRLTLNPVSLWAKRTQTLSISISDDGKNFTELVPSADYKFDPKTGNETIIDFDEVKTQYVRLTITNNTGAKGGQVAEFEVYSKE